MRQQFMLAAVVLLCGCKQQTAHSGANASPKSCLATIGFEGSGRLASDCGSLSGVTHPACDAQNPCEVIHAEIKRRCAALPLNEKAEACETWN
jgi:hypothetical protein